MGNCMGHRNREFSQFLDSSAMICFGLDEELAPREELGKLGVKSGMELLKDPELHRIVNMFDFRVRDRWSRFCSFVGLSGICLLIS
jgi:hypothetical protein